MGDDTRGHHEISGTLLESRLANLEKIAISLPTIVAGILLILSLFLPFVRVTPYSQDDELVALWQLGLAFFGVNATSTEGFDSGDVEAVGLLFGISFLGLLVVVLCSIVGLAVLAHGRVATRAARLLTAVGVLLVVGTAGAWLVIALGATSESPWLPEAASFTLVAGALLVALVTLLPTYRHIWLQRYHPPRFQERPAASDLSTQ